MAKVPITITVPAAFGSWLAGLAAQRDISIDHLVRVSWDEAVEALSAVEPAGEERESMHTAALYLRGLGDLATPTGDAEGYRELSLTLPEELADEIDEQVDRLELPADVIVAWVCEKALEPPADVAVFRS